MEAYMATSAKSQVSSAECNQRLKPNEIAQVKNDFRQNNAHLNQLSFIPVYSSKNMCHKFSKSKNECESPPSERKVLTTYSPPSRPRVLGNNDMVTSRLGKAHMRRRSVGFEDMTSLSACFGHNFTNDRRFQDSGHNSNIPQSSTENHSLFYNSRNSPPSLRKLNQSENRFSLNHNSQLPGDNANDQLHRTERPLQRYKDKSSKRKSSLNRIDFIQFPSLNAGRAQFHADQSQQRNSSSDEDSESRLNAKALGSPSSTTKRKHNASSSSHAASRLEMKTNEITLGSNSPSKVKSNLLPRSSQTGLSHPRQTRWKHPASIRFSQKLSHSAGELESLTDLSEVPSRNKTYLSAQECDDPESSSISFNSGGVITRNSIQKLLPRYLSKNDSLTSKNNTCDNASQGDAKSELANVEHYKHNDSNDLASLKLDCRDNSQLVDQKGNISSETHSEQINISSEHCNSNIKISCDDSKEFNDSDVQSSAVKLESLDITENGSSSSKSIDIYLSADENGEAVNSDGERRPSSILRKKNFEEKKELHSILKPTTDEKFSKAPPSILKHRESSEEKEIWQSSDLHSILKKSTSEDESCNSGTDIRPILKLSTDEDSPSGSLRPRPILKKRTSFSDECSYVSYPSGELKPILKKKTPLSLEEQPKPILKSRRKSEDTRSTTSEVITSRPRAYSADMGVKIGHENQSDNLEVKEDFRKLNSHDL